MAEAIRIKLTIQSNQLSKEDLQLLIQAIRDCEQKSFPDKEISILIEAPELIAVEANEILGSIRPQYKSGLINLYYHRPKTKEAGRE